MAHRALVAVEGRSGRYALYRSRWGGRAPFEGEHAATAAVSAATSGDEPVATVSDAVAVLDALDPRVHEALIIAADGETTSYLVCPLWLGPGVAGTDETHPPPAMLVSTSDSETARRLDRFCRTVREVLADAVEAGLVSAWLAGGYLAVRLAHHPDRSGESLWVWGDRS